MKGLEEENAQYREKTAVLKQEVKDLEKEVIHKTKLQEGEKKTFEKERESFRKRVSQLTPKSSKDSNIQTDTFECEFCELVCPSESLLVNHIKSSHKETSDSFSQQVKLSQIPKPL